MDVFRRLLCLTALVLPTSRRLVHAQLPASAVSEQVRAFYAALARHDTTRGRVVWTAARKKHFGLRRTENLFVTVAAA
jgi:hypothetical protein